MGGEVGSWKYDCARSEVSKNFDLEVFTLQSHIKSLASGLDQSNERTLKANEKLMLSSFCHPILSILSYPYSTLVNKISRLSPWKFQVSWHCYWMWTLFRLPLGMEALAVRTKTTASFSNHTEALLIRYFRLGQNVVCHLTSTGRWFITCSQNVSQH